MSRTYIKEQFFGKPFLYGLIAIIGLFLLSVPAYFLNLSALILLSLAVVIVALTAKNPLLGTYVVFLELFSNSHGHLLFIETSFTDISLRMVVFISFFIGYVIFLLRTRQLPRFSLNKINVLVPLFIAVALGFVTGLLGQNPIAAFQDGNAYLFLLYGFAFFSMDWNVQAKRTLIQMFSAGAVWNILVSLGILYVFSHFGEGILRTSYVFLRDIRLAEITDLTNGVYRVFIQSQFFTITFGAMLLSFLLLGGEREERWRSYITMSGIFAVVFLSLSRSFWIGILVASIVFFLLMACARKKEVHWNMLLTHVIPSVAGAVLLIVIVTLFPIPSQRVDGGNLASAFRSRAEDGVAVSSRWALLDPMLEKIMDRPIIGHGFGTTVSFISDDPRVRELNPNGVWTTYAMEWGWLELWLKMGILGPLSFLLVLMFIASQTLRQLKTDHAWVGISLFVGLIFLFATHIFSPYLNHPIGLGFILMVLILIPMGPPTQTLGQVIQNIRRGMPVRTSVGVLPVESK